MLTKVRSPSSTTISAELWNAVGTTVDAASLMSAHLHEDERWQSLIDRTLLEWLRDPNQLEDDGVDPPSEQILRIGIKHAEWLKHQGESPPDRIVRDPNGGIVFKWCSDESSDELYIWDDGMVESLTFHDARLVERKTLQPADG